MHEYLFTFVGKWSYFGLFLILIAAGLGVPLPEDIPLIASGWIVYRGQGNLYLMMLTGLTGVMVGDTLLFNMGRRYGDHVLEHRWLRRIAKPWLLEKARRQYARHGWKILFLGRFMPGIRSVLFLTAGAFRVPFWLFVCVDGFAALISVPLWIWAGWHFGSRVDQVIKDARLATIIILSALAACLIIWAIYEYRHNLGAPKTRIPEPPARPAESKPKSDPVIQAPTPSDVRPLA